jgi:alkanesulfonate monooxygenase SsuD/methylene tetrahydromethanopterin reductase-like flavin-dependent oxidoreductase (luciferase family)
MGYPDEAARVQELFLAGRRDEALAAMPDEFADEISLVGPPSRIRARLDAWRASPVTALMVGARPPDELRAIRDLVDG